MSRRIPWEEPQPERNAEGPPPSSGGTPQGEGPKHRGKLIVDATVAEQAIRYPTDLGLLNEAREFSERIIDKLYPQTGLRKKPRTYREQAHKAYLALVKQRRPGKQARRRGIKQQLQYLRRNRGHIERLPAPGPEGVEPALPRWLLTRYGVIQSVYAQPGEMYRHQARRGDNRIRAKRADTSAAWINSIFLVMNLLILLRIFFVLSKKELMVDVLRVWKRLFYYRQAHPPAVGILCQSAAP